MKHYKTSEIAKLFSIHPNTVRLYEEWGLLPAVPRNSSGYRLFDQTHVDQIRLIRLVLKCTMFGRGIKKTAYQIIHLAAEGSFRDALECAHNLRDLIDTECRQAAEAEKFLEDWASSIASGAKKVEPDCSKKGVKKTPKNNPPMFRKTSALLWGRPWALKQPPLFSASLRICFETGNATI